MQYSIRKIQYRLDQLGFGPLVVDGIKGPRTDAAIVAFKRSVGLRARPYVGPITYAALLSSNPQPKTEGTVPWMEQAARVKGWHEGRNTYQLKRWFDASLSWIDPRDIPWCGAYVATCLRHWNPDALLPENPLGARNWRHFGQPCTPQFGSVLVFWRSSPDSWKGHVGFYWAEDDTAFHVLGGNQSNAVTVTRIAKSRLIDARWPVGHGALEKRIFVDRGGAPLSTNEA